MTLTLRTVADQPEIYDTPNGWESSSRHIAAVCADVFAGEGWFGGRSVKSPVTPTLVRIQHPPPTECTLTRQSAGSGPPLLLANLIAYGAEAVVLGDALADYAVHWGRQVGARATGGARWAALPEAGATAWPLSSDGSPDAGGSRTAAKISNCFPAPSAPAVRSGRRRPHPRAAPAGAPSSSARAGPTGPVTDGAQPLRASPCPDGERPAVDHS